MRVIKHILFFILMAFIFVFLCWLSTVFLYAILDQHIIILNVFAGVVCAFMTIGIGGSLYDRWLYDNE